MAGVLWGLLGALLIGGVLLLMTLWIFLFE